MGILAHALFVAASHMAPAPEQQAFLETLTDGLASAAEEATCTEGWAELDFCKPTWTGSARSLAVLGLTVSFYESRWQERIQKGDCRIWGPLPSQRECDGALFPKGAAPSWGLRRQSPWGTVVFRSLTAFQIRDLSASRRAEVLGSESVPVFEASRAALAILAGHRARCQSEAWLECTIASYAGSPRFRQTATRARTYRALMRRTEPTPTTERSVRGRSTTLLGTPCNVGACVRRSGSASKDDATRIRDTKRARSTPANSNPRRLADAQALDPCDPTRTSGIASMVSRSREAASGQARREQSPKCGRALSPSFGCRGWIRTNDLRVMSPASY